ncbi:MAG: hypothetical protein H5T97_08985, partial [Firmicutes bacterium]|nr:hypothetical protein [Bacillota bacterium]
MNGLRILLALILGFLTWFLTAAECIPVATSPVPEELQARVEEIFATRARAIITGADPAPVLADYDVDSKLGRWALAHERSKLNFVQLWAQKRGVRISEAEASISIPWFRMHGDSAEFLVYQTLRLGYVYPGDNRVNNFGIGTRHAMKLVRKDGRWLIRQDFYTDGLGDDTLVPNPTPADGPALVGSAAEIAPSGGLKAGAYDREGAVRYADKYAGL